jgi:hypothetical protein
VALRALDEGRLVDPFPNHDFFAEKGRSVVDEGGGN